MSDEPKVINLFEHRRTGIAQLADERGELIETADGYTYVSRKYTHEEAAKEESLLKDVAEHQAYIFKMIEHHNDYIRVDSYYVPGNRLHEFTLGIATRPGELLAIEHFIPDTMA